MNGITPTKNMLQSMSDNELVNTLVYVAIESCEMNRRDSVTALKKEVLRRLQHNHD